MCPQKSIFCRVDFGSSIALDLQQKLKPFLHSSKAVVLKLLLLRCLWKSLLNLRRTSNRMLININVLFINQAKKKYASFNVMCGLAYFIQSSLNLGRICETAKPMSLSRFICDRYLVLITAMAENLASHKYDVEKGITIIRNIFSLELDNRRSMKCKNLPDLRNSLKLSFQGIITGKVSIVLIFFLFSKGG